MNFQDEHLQLVNGFFSTAIPSSKLPDTRDSSRRCSVSVEVASQAKGNERMTVSTPRLDASQSITLRLKSRQAQVSEADETIVTGGTDPQEGGAICREVASSGKAS